MWTFSAVNIHNFVVNMPTFLAVMGFEQLHTLHKKCSFTLYLQKLIIYGISSCKSLGHLQRLAVYAHVSTCMYPIACTRTITTSCIIVHHNTHTCMHPTNTYITTILVMDWSKTEDCNDKAVCRREEVGFQFSLLKQNEKECLDRERKRVPDDRSGVLKGSLPQGPPAHHQTMEALSSWGWAKRVRRRVEMKQLNEVWRCCTTDNVEAGESYFVLNLLMGRECTSESKGVLWAEFGTLQMRLEQFQLITLWILWLIEESQHGKHYNKYYQD